jgi:hypothetical protein
MEDKAGRWAGRYLHFSDIYQPILVSLAVHNQRVRTAGIQKWEIWEIFYATNII